MPFESALEPAHRRYAALSTCIVTGVAAFVYHKADVGHSGLTATVFFAMCLTLMIAGPGWKEGIPRPSAPIASKNAATPSTAAASDCARRRLLNGKKK